MAVYVPFPFLSITTSQMISLSSQSICAVKELFEILKLSHIYIKEIEEGLSYFSFKINSSQLLLVRQIILKKYFIQMLNV